MSNRNRPIVCGPFSPIFSGKSTTELDPPGLSCFRMQTPQWIEAFYGVICDLFILTATQHGFLPILGLMAPYTSLSIYPEWVHGVRNS